MGVKGPKKRSEIEKGEVGDGYLDDRWAVNRKICHGDPERSFYFRGRPMPLCARCSGLYYSVIPGILLSIPLYLNLDPPMEILIPMAIITQSPWIIDAVTQYYRMRRSNNALRLITGILGGLGWGFFLGFWILVLIQ